MKFLPVIILLIFSFVSIFKPHFVLKMKKATTSLYWSEKTNLIYIRVFGVIFFLAAVLVFLLALVN